MELGDLDQDGDLEIVTANYFNSTISVLLNGTLGNPASQLRSHVQQPAEPQVTPLVVRLSDTDLHRVNDAAMTVWQRLLA